MRQGLARLERNSECPANDSPDSGRLSISRLTLTDFRCYHHQRLETTPHPVVLTGPNGAGKTNLLEALSFLVPGRGLRRARLSEVARHRPGEGDNTDPRATWAVAARVSTPGGEVDIGTGRDGQTAHTSESGANKRAVHVDRQACKSQAALAEVLNVHWLTPNMDRLFSEGAASRRRFVDRLVFGFDPAHAGRVSAYTHALRERARLLRRQREGRGADTEWLAALEDTMARKGVAVAAARREMIQSLDAICAKDNGPFPGARLDFRGDIESWLDQGPALEAEDRLRAALVETRRTDTESGGAGAGAHRSDLQVRHLAKDCLAAQCSTGEQKALLIAIVLANARLQTAERRTAPILLLDEVAAHLDGMRRDALFEEVSALGSQAWLAGTDADIFSSLRGKAQFFTVEDGTVTAAD